MSDPTVPTVGGVPLESRTLLSSLGCEVCPACRGSKRSRQTLCGRCYYALPGPMRRALYARIGDGYDAAVKEAMDYLRAETFSVPTMT